MGAMAKNERARRSEVEKLIRITDHIWELLHHPPPRHRPASGIHGSSAVRVLAGYRNWSIGLTYGTLPFDHLWVMDPIHQSLERSVNCVTHWVAAINLAVHAPFEWVILGVHYTPWPQVPMSIQRYASYTTRLNQSLVIPPKLTIKDQSTRWGALVVRLRPHILMRTHSPREGNE